MLKNWEHVELQNQMAIQFHFTPFKEEDSTFEYSELPFPRIEKPEVFNRNKAWEEAKEYDVDNLKQLIGF